MIYDCRNAMEWVFTGLLCVLSFLTAIYLARRIAARLAGTAPIQLPDRRWRFGWMFGLAFYGLLLVFDGRYRDFPLGLFWPPAVGFFIAALMESAGYCVVPIIEERFMACLLPLLAAVVVAQEIGLNPTTWLWLAVNLASAGAVMIEWRRAGRLQTHQPQATHQ